MHDAVQLMRSEFSRCLPSRLVQPPKDRFGIDLRLRFVAET